MTGGPIEGSSCQLQLAILAILANHTLYTAGVYQKLKDLHFLPIFW
jgi:hypothetical protein